MIAEIVGWGLLTGIIIFQQVLIGQLTSKLMSRNFGEYAVANRTMKLKPEVKKPEAEDFDDYAATQATKANRLFRA